MDKEKIMIRVTYTIKIESNLLIDDSITFRYMRDAIKFLREVLRNERLVGKPMIERLVS